MSLSRVQESACPAASARDRGAPRRDARGPRPQEGKLIYDVGLHDGRDTAYYLRLGFRVVAVEANGILSAAAARRFAREIAAGRLELLNVGISATGGVARFWICDDHDEWSSFDRAIASRNGCAHHPIDVPTIPFGTLLEQFGVPFYCKIDIEGNDLLCLEAMRPRLAPPYISMELMRSSRADPLAILCELGYKRFKVIDQRRFCTVEPRIYRWLGARWPIGRLSREVNRALRSRSSHRGWRFAEGSSGPIGPATPGRWLDRRSVRELCSWVEDHMRSRGLAEWFDLHAAL